MCIGALEIPVSGKSSSLHFHDVQGYWNVYAHCSFLTQDNKSGNHLIIVLWWTTPIVAKNKIRIWKVKEFINAESKEWQLLVSMVPRIISVSQGNSGKLISSWTNILGNACTLLLFIENEKGSSINYQQMPTSKLRFTNKCLDNLSERCALATHFMKHTFSCNVASHSNAYC